MLTKAIQLCLIFSLLQFIAFSNNKNCINPEKIWALKHPFAACKVKKISAQCYLIYNDTSLRHQLDTFSNGGKSDAFRHVFFMLAFSQQVKITALRKLGKAHEKKNYQEFLKNTSNHLDHPDSLGTVMDLNNNELAFQLSSLNSKLSLEELKNLVIEEINSGRALIVKRNRQNNYLSCENEVIDLNLYLRQWNIPKCLVASNFTYKD